MAKVINLSERLSNELPAIQVGDKKYEVKNDITTVSKFQELQAEATVESLVKAVEMAIGKAAVKELKVTSMPYSDFKVLTIGMFAAMTDMDYEEAAARFQDAQPEE